MEESRRSGEKSGIVVKNRTSSGCLIVRKKSEGVSVAGSSGTRKAFESKKERKRPRLILSDSGSSDELLMPPRRRLGPETIRVCNGLSSLEKGAMEENEFGRKRDRDRLEFTGNTEDGLIVRNEGLSDRKRNRLDVFEFDEYDGVDEEILRSGVGIGGRRFLGSSVRSGIGRDYGTGSSRHAIMDKRKNVYFERTSSFNQGGMNRFGMDRDIARTPIPLLREKRLGDSEEPIRVQGKNGVLKVMVNKKKKVAESIRNNNHLDAEVNRSSSKFERTVMKTVKSSVRTPSCLETEVHAKSGSFARAEQNSEVLERRGSSVRKEKNQIRLQKSQTTKNIKRDDSDSDESDTALKLGPKGKESHKAVKDDSSGSEKTPGRKLTLSRIKEGKAKRGSGTEKQKLREKIRGMLIDAGWTIDYRPRRNRDYLDAVYINPSGTAYWSIIKAYDALLKQLNEEEVEAKPIADGSFSPLPDEVLGQLTRKTKKKMEKEMKRKQRDSCQGVNARETSTRKSLSTRHDDESMGSISHEDKLSSFMKGGKSSKIRVSENGLHDGNGKLSSASASHLPHGRKSRKLGRCTLLVRNSSKGPNSETDGFTPYAGKRTLLSWLIDLGNVQLSEKVQYMNRRRTKIMLEGWVTRDGIHCGCCSKILTVSKFEIHAASKLRQPFQHICLESGVSLLQCQMDAWKKLVETQNIGFNSVHIDGDDPNDDTCGICGDGGDLICCDGCPSTFHQSCLDIQMLPPGDWHCPNCTCKFCGVAGEHVVQGDSATACYLLTCSMCDKKYHELCIQDMDACSLDSNGSVPFCGQKCRELFEHLQKNLGVKHELESGYTWSLIRRTDEDPDSVLRGSPQRVECNSKLAVALTVMDECFLPIVDRRSGINLIRNVLYNSGSNFNRLNYGGFYTAVLERGDEIISAASIRFHGTQLAEMPFIGTRHIYRRQGMCRRLFCALESALCSCKVEKLVIPAISELMHTWTTVFGFTPLEESVKRELRSLNMLVFPGVDMLQKQLLEKENTNDDLTPGSGSKLMESNTKHGIKTEVDNKPGIALSAEHDNVNFCADDARNGEIAAGDVDPKCADVSSDDTSTHTGSPDPTGVDSESGDKLAVSASDVKSLSNSEEGNDASEMENKPESSALAGEDISTRSIKEGENNNALMMDVDTAASHVEEIAIPEEELVESVSEWKSLTIANTSDGDLVIRDKTEADLPVEDNTVADNADTSHEFKTPDPVEETAAESAADMKCPTPGTSNGETKIEDKLVLFSSSEDDTQSCKDSGVLPSAISSHLKSGDKLVKIEPPVENKPVYCPSIEDNAQSCKEVDMDDAHAEDLGVAATNEVQTLEAACHKKSPLAPGIINDSPEKQNGLLSTTPVEDISQSCKVGDVGTASAGQPLMKHQQSLEPDYDKTQSCKESVMNGDFTTTGEKEKFSDMSSSLPTTFETDSEERHCGSEILDGKDKS